MQRYSRYVCICISPTLPLSVSISHVFIGPTFFLQFDMACRNLCQRLYSKIIFGKSHYAGGKKYCRRCEIYFSYDGVFCPCCGMALRMFPRLALPPLVVPPFPPLPFSPLKLP